MSSPLERSVGIISTGTPVVSKRLQNVVTVGLPSLVTAYGIYEGVTVEWIAVLLAAVFFVAGGLGAGIGLHRYFTHHAFRTGTFGRGVLGVLGSWAWQGPVAQWVADHRRHHRFADTPLDPHSPHWVGDEPPKTVAGGLAHAHLGWMLFGDVSDPGRYAADILNEPISRWCSRLYWPLALSTLVLPAALGYLVGGAATAVSCVVWAGFARVAAIQHFTWAIASFGHRFGDQLPEAKDEARDNLVLAILLFGEGLHSYHHVNPSLAVNQPESLDLNGKILRYCERRGWIWDLKCEPVPV